jgi:hypothetical protein
MLHFVDHAANSRCIFQRTLAAHLVQAKTDQRRALRCFTGDRAADLFHGDCLTGFRCFISLFAAAFGAALGAAAFFAVSFAGAFFFASSVMIDLKSTF